MSGKFKNIVRDRTKTLSMWKKRPRYYSNGESVSISYSKKEISGGKNEKRLATILDIAMIYRESLYPLRLFCGKKMISMECDFFLVAR